MLLHGGLKPQLRQDFDDGGTYSVLRWGVRVLEQIYSIMCTYIYIDNITTYNISYIYMNYNVCILYIYTWLNLRHTLECSDILFFIHFKPHSN